MKVKHVIVTEIKIRNSHTVTVMKNKVETVRFNQSQRYKVAIMRYKLTIVYNEV